MNDDPSVRGFALLIVLWTLVLITLVVSQLAAAGQSESRLAHNLQMAQAAQDAADGAVYQAILHLSEPGPKSWLADGRAYDLGKNVSVRVMDEAGKINPNSAPVALLQALLLSLGIDTRTAGQVAQNIAAWRSPDGDTTQLIAAYQAAGRDYAPPQASIQSLDEVGLILGVTPAMLAKLRPHLTVWYTGYPDPAKADPVVAQALHDQAGAAFVPALTDGSQRVLTVSVLATQAGARATRQAVVLLARGGSWLVLDWARNTNRP